MTFSSLTSFSSVRNNKFNVLVPYGVAPTDYVAYIAMNVASWTANTTKDVTGTFTLYADNTLMINDTTRGYVIPTSSGFDGVALATPIVVNFCPSYSYSVWIKITSALSTSVSNGIVGDHLASAGAFYLYFSSSGILTATHGSSPTSDILTYGTNIATLNTWIHIGITYNNTTLLMTMYVNGTAVSSKTKSASWTGFGSSTGGRVTFGYARFPIFYGYTGLIDNMRLYNRELSSTEMYNIYGYESVNPTIQ